MKPIKSLSWISRLLGSDPVPAPPHVLAVDRQSVRYAKFGTSNGRRANGAVDLIEYHERPLPDDVFSDGPLGGGVREAHTLRDVVGEVVELASGRIDRASLVVPDDWLRVSFAELDGLPKKSAARHEMVLWKLKRLVPFRVEDLRVTHLEVEPLPAQKEEHRLLVGFGIEGLLSQLEGLFEERDIQVGRITNESLSLLGALPDVSEDRLRAVTIVTDDGYTILLSRSELPVLYRYKGLDPTVGERRVVRDLRLSRMFLAEQLADAPLQAIGLLAPEDRAEDWRAWLGATFDTAVVDLGAHELGLAESPSGVEWRRVATLIGAMRQEVA